MIPRTPMARVPSTPPPSYRPRIPPTPPPAFVPVPQAQRRPGERPPPAGVHDLPAKYTSSVIHFGIGVPVPGGEGEIGDATGGRSEPADVSPQASSSLGRAPAGVSPQDWLGPEPPPAAVSPQVGGPSQPPPPQVISSPAGVYPQAGELPGEVAQPTPEASPKGKRLGVLRRPAAARLPTPKSAGVIPPATKSKGSQPAPVVPELTKWQEQKMR